MHEAAVRSLPAALCQERIGSEEQQCSIPSIQILQRVIMHDREDLEPVRSDDRSGKT